MTTTALGVEASPGHHVEGLMTRDVIGPDVEASVRAAYDAEFGRLAGWTTRLVADPDLAHDFAAEAFVKLFRNWSTVREPRAWLYVAVCEPRARPLAQARSRGHGIRAVRGRRT